MRALLLTLLIATTVCPQGAVQKSLDLDEIRRLPILHRDRYKPLDTFAREIVREVTGKVKLDGTDPVLLFLAWRFDPELARTGRFIRLPEVRVAKQLGFDIASSEDVRVAWDVVRASETFHARVGALRSKDPETLTSDETEILRVDNRWQALGAIAGLGSSWQGAEPGIRGWLPAVPPAQAPEPGVRYQWVSPQEMIHAGWSAARAESVADALRALRTAYLADDSSAFDAAASELISSVQALGLPTEGKLAFTGMDMMDREVLHNRARPFMFSWVIYLLAVPLALLAMPFRSRTLWILPLVVLGCGLTLHTWGMIERTAISGRALVGTFYESMVYVAAAAALLGIVFELVFRRKWFVLSGSLLAFVGLYVAESFPDFMAPEISKLRPVLNNNSLIHVHVPAIMTAYAALFLAFVLAHVYLVRFFWRGDRDPQQTELVRFMYWVIPVGEVLLFAGIILGGVWADASWGRFWGWDPKETASAITFLVYMVVIHGRWAGWLRSFGSAIGSLIGGWSLLWTYYGANFFQTGLHSYAAADADRSIPTWLWIFTGVELALFTAALLVHARNRRRTVGANTRGMGTTPRLTPSSGA